MLRTAAALAVAAALLAPAAASAQVCVGIDASRDTLSEQDRRSAAILLERAFERNGLEVVTSGCTRQYFANHVQLGQAILVTLWGPEGSRDMKAASIEELDAVYAQLVPALLKGLPIGRTVDRESVTTAQAEPKRMRSDNFFYVRLGYGAIAGAGFNGGPAFGLGWRYELDSFGIDASVLNLVIPTGDDDADGLTGSFVKIAFLYFFDGKADKSPYLGAGLSWGGTAICDDRCYGDSGLQAELQVGYELLRASTIRFFSELNVVMPFYTADSDLSGDDDSIYTPVFSLSVGLGFGKNRRW